jgi:tripartite-type tricarboxylate transporter receptor subunit TctC
MQECQEALDTLNEKLVTTPILVFLDWSNLFHVHVDASSIVLGAVLAQWSEGNIDHLVYFVGHKLSDVENNYTTTEHEGLAMVYALQNF